MWCTKCHMETESAVCPECHGDTVQIPENGVHWCPACRVPILSVPEMRESSTSEQVCPLCGGPVEYLASDLRPVFPEERLLVELLLGKEPNTYINSSVWAANSRYYIDGKSISVSTKYFQKADTDKLAAQLNKYKAQNSYGTFNKFANDFVRANLMRL